MRARVLFSFVAALVAAVALASASGAATARAQKVARIDVSTRAAVIHYLRSIHFNVKGAVIQRGALNYAGARCPGSAWTCASTRRTVVQIAKRGGENRFVCRSSHCAVVQLAGVSHGLYLVGRPLASTSASSKGNTAICIKTSGLGQSCAISQSSPGGNTAGVYEDNNKTTGLTQTASFNASITQQATSGDNTACVHQVIAMDGSTNLSGKKATPITVALEAHQTITITQDSASGHNYASHEALATATNFCTAARLNQSQSLTSTAGGSGAGSVTQNEDAASNGPNMSLDIEQNQHSANGSPTSAGNDATFTQSDSLSAVAYTPANGSVSQTQSSTVGGILAKVNQDAHGVSNADAQQNEVQCEDAYAQMSIPAAGCSTTEHGGSGLASLTQNQFGPVHKTPGDSSQTGNENCSPPNCDSFTVTQRSQQDSDSGSTQTNDVSGGFDTTGNGSVTQTTDENGSMTTSTQTGQNVSAQTTCSGSVCTPSGTDYNVLIAGTGDFGYTNPNDNIAQALTNAGYTVTESPTLPADLSSFGEVWWVDATPPTADEQTQLVNFANSGKGVFLTGENAGCCGSLNAADQAMVNSIVTNAGITVGADSVCCSGQAVAYPVNATVVGNLATQPHTITDWTATYPGDISGMPDSSIFAYYHPDQTTTQVVAAAWDRSSTVGKGRLALFMDINWAESGTDGFGNPLQGANFSDVVENVAFFLSGLGSPPAPPVVLQAPIAGLSLYRAQMTPARTSTSSASTTTASAR